MANERSVKIFKTTSSPLMVFSEITFDSDGKAPVTASSLGLAKIEAFCGNAWGGTTDGLATVYATTDFATGGVASIALELRRTDSGSDTDLVKTISLIFFGI